MKIIVQIKRLDNIRQSIYDWVLIILDSLNQTTGTREHSQEVKVDMLVT